MPPEQTHSQKASGELRRIHTFQSDVEELVRKESVSKTDIALAENERKRKEAAAAPESVANQPRILRVSSGLPLAPRWNWKLIILVSVAALAFGGVGVGAVFLFKDRRPAKPTEAPPTVPKITAVKFTGTESRAGAIKTIRDALNAASVPQNELRTIPLMGDTSPIAVAELFNMLETSAPPALARALGPLLTLGVYGFKGGQPFLLFGVSSYDYAFNGMLLWERTLLDEMGPLFGTLPRDILKNAGDTTAEARENTIAFKDIIIRNKDARAAFSPEGIIVFAYSFLDKQTLVFATNDETLKALMSKAGGGKLR